MYEIALITGIITGFLRGGSLEKLAKIPFKYAHLIVFSLIIQIGLSVLSYWFYVPHIIGYFLILFSNLILISALFLNRKDFFIQIMIFGIFLNFLVIAINGGMPILTKSAKLIGINQKNLTLNLKNDYRRVAVVPNKTSLFFLGEIVPLPPPYPFPSVYSLGDIITSIGLFLYLQSNLAYKARRKTAGDMPLIN